MTTVVDKASRQSAVNAFICWAQRLTADYYSMRNIVYRNLSFTF